MTTIARIEETPGAGRLGRNIRHDPRSLAYRIRVPEDLTVQSVTWTRHIPVLDQGTLGSCTGNACVGVLGTEPYVSTMPSGWDDTEREAVALYSAAEKIDGGEGYPPEDQGSSGLSVAKAAKNIGLVSGYQHITSISAAMTAIQTGPFLVGSNWYSGMDKPDGDGIVSPTGSVRGGHEYECHGYDAANDLWWFYNSWGTSWGLEGRFAYSTASFSQLLARQGDATVLVALSEPAPTPHPVTNDADIALASAIPDGWLTASHTGDTHTVATALSGWKSALGL